MEFTKVGTEQMSILVLGTVLMLVVPLVISIVWTIKKKEKFTTVLVGAATFLLFAIILEKPIQNLLVFPTQMGLADHAISRFLNANPVLWALAVGLFPGVFEETGRFFAYKTVLRKRKNRETSISYGIGHSGFEVMSVLGVTYVMYVAYALMINSGAFGSLVDQVMAQVPDQADSLYTVADQLAAFSLAGLGMSIAERIFAVMFHIGASIIVFYACKDKSKFWLYPVAIMLHTAMDFIVGLVLVKVFNTSALVLEGIIAAFGILTFCGAYFLLYRRDMENGVNTH